MRSRAVVAFAVTALLGVALVVVLGARQERTLAFTLGVPDHGVSVLLRPGRTACQQPIPVGAPFDEVELSAGTYGAPGPALDVTVLRADDGATLGRGRVAGGYGDNEPQRVAVGRIDDDQSIAVCVRNAGARKLGLYGGPDVTSRTSSAQLDGVPQETDVQLTFHESRSRTSLALLPDVLARAALFRGDWVGPWLYWLLLAGVLVAVPALLAVALARAASSESEPPGAD